MIEIYTDGACKGNGKTNVDGNSNHNQGGYGVLICYDNGDKHHIWGGASDTTNNRMELTAVITALQNTDPACPVQIFTDSNYVYNGITKWYKDWEKTNFKHKKNVDLWHQLNALSQNRDIDWQWVKGHADNEGNIIADQLANDGVTSSGNQWFYTNNNNNSDSQNNKPKQSKKTTQPRTNKNSPDNKKTAKKKDDTAKKTTAKKTATKTTTTKKTKTQDPQDNNQPSGHLIDNNLSTPNDLADTAINANASDDNQSSLAPTINYQISEQTAKTTADPTPIFDGDTSFANAGFVPLLPDPVNHGKAERQLIMDTETTGFDEQNGDRIVEVGIVEMIGRKFTGEKLHVYINPDKQMDEEVIKIHGISNEFLVDKPRFADVAQKIYDFMAGAEIIAHNATFDMRFLTMEFDKAGLPDFANKVQITDSLAIAKQAYPGQKNSLDALVKRLDVGKQDRTFHGALLDSEILAEVYLAMTGGQVALAIDDDNFTHSSTNDSDNLSTLAHKLSPSVANHNADMAWRQDVLGLEA